MRVEFPSGPDTLAGELIVPANQPAPGIVVLHDVWGLSDLYRGIARRIAAAGFNALALDLYARGESPGTPADMPAVMRFMSALPDRRVLADVEAAAEWLRARPEVAGRSIGLTGFCMGGKYAFLAAANCRGLAAVVPWYGMLRAPALDANNPEHALDALARPHPPILALFGADDALIPLADVDELRSRSAERGTDVDVVVYPGAGHAFANEARPEVYREAAASDGWNRALAFFAKHLERD